MDPCLDVVCALARSKLNDAKVGEPALVERVLTDDAFDVLSALAHCHDDSTISWYLSARDQKIAGSVVFLQENDMRGHARVDLSEADLVREFDDEHGGPSL
jgi:hypothetical protein